MRSITVEQAKAMADDWKAQRADFDQQPRADYFSECSPHDLIAMWETGKRTNGKRLSSYELGCLVEAWCVCFGCLPPFASLTTAASTERTKHEPIPADDTMLRMPDVERLTGMSKSTIKRAVNSGSFPKPLRLGIRAKGWPARDVKQFLDTLEEQRRRPRQ